MREGAGGGEASFDALNKNIRETNKQGREGEEDEDGDEVVRKHHVTTHGNLGMVMVEKPLPVYDGKIA